MPEFSNDEINVMCIYDMIRVTAPSKRCKPI